MLQRDGYVFKWLVLSNNPKPTDKQFTTMYYKEKHKTPI